MSAGVVGGRGTRVLGAAAAASSSGKRLSYLFAISSGIRRPTVTGTGRHTRTAPSWTRTIRLLTHQGSFFEICELRAGEAAAGIG